MERQCRDPKRLPLEKSYWLIETPHQHQIFIIGETHSKGTMKETYLVTSRDNIGGCIPNSHTEKLVWMEGFRVWWLLAEIREGGAIRQEVLH